MFFDVGDLRTKIRPAFAPISLAFNHLAHYYFDRSTETVDPFFPSQTFQPIPAHYWSIIAQRIESLRCASRLVVSKVELCRTERNLHHSHEFLIVSLRHRSTSRTTCFLTERRQLSHPFLTENQESQSAPDDRVFTPAEGFRAGVDVYVQHTYGPYKILSTFRPLQGISAAQLSVLLDVPGKTEPDRVVYSNESAWYAESIYSAIKHLSPGRMEEPIKQKIKEKIALQTYSSPNASGILDLYNSEWITLIHKYPNALA